MKSLDSFDLKILREMQQNAEISMQDLGEKVVKRTWPLCSW